MTPRRAGRLADPPGWSAKTGRCDEACAAVCDNPAVSNRYPLIDVSSVTRDLIEPMGTKRKFWFTDADGARWLFKYSRPQTGEHWAEKIAAEIGARLEIPIARVELGMCDGSPGACSQSFHSGCSGTIQYAFLLAGREPLARRRTDHRAARS
jgi:hypothetical protein